MGPGQTQKAGPSIWIVGGGLGGTPLGNFEILHALKYVLGAPEALFCTCIQYLQVTVLNLWFQIENMTYRALASGLRSTFTII